MDDSALFKQLLTYVRTKEELNKVKEALDIYLSSRFSLQENVNPFAKLSPALTELLKSILSKEQSIEKTKIIVDQLNNKMSACPLLHLTIAFLPTDATIGKLSSKVKHLFGPDCLVDITTDPSILGGIVFIQNGNYQDLSIKKKLDHVFTTRQEEIKALII